MRQHLGSRKLVVAVMVTQQDDRQGTADVIATTFLGEETLERKAGSLPDASVSMPGTATVSIPMCFRSEGWSGWHLDGKRTAVMPPLPGGTPGLRPAARGERRRADLDSVICEILDSGSKCHCGCKIRGVGRPRAA